ncbi:hypothetical protein [Anatilimnocola floriformis]|uniref:hypothetical protein n=1 Tax=Anatilimnocola floriformis TaxID=2948575 RepID=UPI0020C265D9|nr:hypothetical protein [Anatilimnocola floriformis]
MAANDSNTDSLGSPPTIIQAQAHTTPDGVLNLSVPVGLADVDVAVVLQVKALRVSTDLDENGWPRGYFEQVPGSMPDLQRPPQGEFERRLPFE